jgi:hypothetical protein
VGAKIHGLFLDHEIEVMARGMPVIYSIDAAHQTLTCNELDTDPSKAPKYDCKYDELAEYHFRYAESQFMRYTYIRHASCNILNTTPIDVYVMLQMHIPVNI